MNDDAQETSGKVRFRARWLLLMAPYLGLCFPQVYVRATPTLFGFPFFYWYQLAWVLLTSALLWVYYRLTTRPE